MLELTWSERLPPHASNVRNDDPAITQLHQPCNYTEQLLAVVESSSYRITLRTMASPDVHHLFHAPIADHSFSADHSTLAVARDTTVELYGKVGNAFKLKDELKGHDKTITSVDIAPNSGRIVSCSQGLLPPILISTAVTLTHR